MKPGEPLWPVVRHRMHRTPVPGGVVGTQGMWYGGVGRSVGAHRGTGPGHQYSLFYRVLLHFPVILHFSGNSSLFGNSQFFRDFSVTR